MSEKITSLAGNVKKFITDLINPDMSKDQIEKYNNVLKLCDDLVEENSSQEKELHECKELIINNLKNQGSSDKPSEEQHETQPRSLEEIAQAITSK